MTIVALPEWSLFSVSRVVIRSAEQCPVRKDSDFEGLSIYARCSGALGPVWNECASSKVPGPCDRDGWKQWLAKPSRSHEFRSLDTLFGTKLSVYDEDTCCTRYDPFLGTDQRLHHFIMQHDKSVGTHGVLHSSSCAVAHGSPNVSTPSKVCAKPLPRYKCPKTDVGSVSGETSFVFSTKLFGSNPDVLFGVSASVLTVRCGGTPAASDPQGISQLYSHFVGFNTTTFKDRREVDRSVRPDAMVSLNRLLRDMSRFTSQTWRRSTQSWTSQHARIRVHVNPVQTSSLRWGH